MIDPDIDPLNGDGGLEFGRSQELYNRPGHIGLPYTRKGGLCLVRRNT